MGIAKLQIVFITVSLTGNYPCSAPAVATAGVGMT